MKKLLPFIIFASLFLPLEAQEAAPDKERMVTRQYFLESPRWVTITQNTHGDPFGNDPGDEPELPWSRKTSNPGDMQRFFSKNYGIGFPEGSWIRYQSIGYKIVITLHNTILNHDRMRYALMVTGAITVNVHLNLRLVAFDAAEIDAMERQQAGGLSDQALLDLWKNGKGDTLSSQSVKTQPGVNAIIEIGDEMIYPADTIRTVNADTQTETLKFESQLAGNILNITPSLVPDLKNVGVMILPEFTQFRGGNPDADEKLRAFTPVFRSLNATTSMVVPNGGTRMLGQSTSLDGKQQLVLFLSAEIQEPNGSPLLIEVPDMLQLDEE